MPKENKTLEGLTPQEKRHHTNLKSAGGAYFLALIMTLIYIVHTFLAKRFDFYFSLFVPEVLLKSAAATQNFDGSFSDAFTAQWQGHLPTVLAFALILLYLVIFLIPALVAQKKPKALLGAFVLYFVDTALLVAGRVLQIPEAMGRDGWIDPVFHGIMLIFLIVGIRAAFQKPPEEQPQDEQSAAA